MKLKTIDTPAVPVRYFHGGDGKAVLYLHGAGGLTQDDPFLNALAKEFEVYAPLLPGYGDSEEAPLLRDMLDITLHTWDVARELKLKKPILVGHSMGGMIAAEMAAIQPNDVNKLALIAPAGLWLDDYPIPDIFTMLPFEMPAYLFHDVAAGAQAMTAGAAMDDPAFLQTYLVTNARQLGMAGKLLFPVPERGLSTRLHRIRAKTLLIWGDSDKLIPPVYARKFKEAIKGAKLVSIPEAGHMVQMEKTAQVVEAVKRLA